MSLSLWAGIGNITAIKGSALVVRHSGSVDAKSGMNLLEHDRIQTQRKSRVQVMLKDNTVVTIGANSSFRFDTFSYDGTKKSQLAMSAQRGFFRSVTGKIGHIAPERFKVKTVSATIGIRGTDFSANIMSDMEVIRCYSGKITVDFAGQSQEVVAGMQIELHKENGTLKAQEPHTQKTTSTSQEKKSDETSIESTDINTNEVQTEVISDITQIINDPVNEEVESAQGTDTPQNSDPFTITPAAEDRPVQY